MWQVTPFAPSTISWSTGLNWPTKDTTLGWCCSQKVPFVFGLYQRMCLPQEKISTITLWTDPPVLHKFAKRFNVKSAVNLPNSTKFSFRHNQKYKWIRKIKQKQQRKKQQSSSLWKICLSIRCWQWLKNADSKWGVIESKNFTICIRSMLEGSTRWDIVLACWVLQPFLAHTCSW